MLAFNFLRPRSLAKPTMTLLKVTIQGNARHVQSVLNLQKLRAYTRLRTSPYFNCSSTPPLSCLSAGDRARSVFITIVRNTVITNYTYDDRPAHVDSRWCSLLRTDTPFNLAHCSSPARILALSCHHSIMRLPI